MMAKESGMRRHLGGLALVIVCLLGTAVSAQDSDLTAGKLLYQENCGVCHGMIESDARYHLPGEPLGQRVQAGMWPSGVRKWALRCVNDRYAQRGRTRGRRR